MEDDWQPNPNKRLSKAEVEKVAKLLAGAIQKYGVNPAFEWFNNYPIHQTDREIIKAYMFKEFYLPTLH